MKPSLAIQNRRADILVLAEKYQANNLRVFGSVLRREDKDASDLDLLVDTLPGTNLFHLGGLQDELQQLLGVKVEVLTSQDLPVAFRARVLAEAVSI
jgi:uncharacterized protein